ncbi:MAG: flagellar export chaperone FlgN [Solirubrobacteraceae bacterium]
MTVVVHETDAIFTGDVLAHLDAQLVAARRLLQVVLEQGAAIRRRDVKSVVALTGILQAELQRRQLLDAERMRLLERAGARLGVIPGGVTLSRLETLLDPQGAQMARERSSELRGLLEETKREHHVNRALMSQELAFLDHLLRLAGEGGETIYDRAGERPTSVPVAYTANRRTLNLEV